MSFKEDLELARKAEKYQDDVYRSLFDSVNVTRFDDRSHKKILDIEYHIDVELKLDNGVQLLGQEKALRNNFSKFNTFTMEFYQNRFTKEQGEFFNLGAQFYLHGYWNKNYNGLEKWYLIKIFDFLTHLKKTSIDTLEKFTRPSTSRASFFYVNYNKIPDEFIYAKKIDNAS